MNEFHPSSVILQSLKKWISTLRTFAHSDFALYAVEMTTISQPYCVQNYCTDKKERERE